MVDARSVILARATGPWNSRGRGSRLDRTPTFGPVFDYGGHGMNPRKRNPFFGAALGTVSLAGLLPACSKEAPAGPSLVVITLDTFRADRIGAYGSKQGLTPNIDRIAAEASLFENAITPIGTTHPAHASLFTGLYPGEHGVRFNGDVLKDNARTLAEWMEEAGYETGAFVSKRNLVVRGGFQQGFETRSDVDAVGKDKTRTGAEVNALALPWLESVKDEAFFMWVHYFETHSPLEKTAHAAEQMGDYDGPLRDGAPTKLLYALGSDELPNTPENRAAISALYDGEVKETDRLVGEVMEKLRALGRLDDTIVVVVADHGELLGEHGEIGHGFHVNQEVLHVPLLIREPGGGPARRITQRASLIDFLPTIAERLDLPRPATSGRSLARLIRGETLPEIPQFASVRTPRLEEKGGEREEDVASIAAFFGCYKLVLSSEGAVVFDLSDDPMESAPAGSAAAEKAREKLLPLAADHRVRERPDSTPVDLPPDVLEELEQLGYIR